MSMTTRRQLLANGALLITAAASGGGVLAQQRIVTLTVPFAPGGSTDALARLLQAGLQKRLGTTVIVENKAGAASALGAAQVAKSAPDGTNFLVTFDSHGVIPSLLETPPLDVERDLAPVMLVGTSPYVLAVNASRPYKTFADVVADAKKRPGEISFASTGTGTIGHLAMTLLGKRLGVKWNHVPYRSGGLAINDAVGGHVDLIVGSSALLLPHFAGALRPIMQMGPKRLDLMPETQTAIEAGNADFTALAWWGVFAPKGSPDAVIETMFKALSETLAEPAISTQLRETQQMLLLAQGPQELKSFFTRQVQEWGQVVKENGIRAQ